MVNDCAKRMISSFVDSYEPCEYLEFISEIGKVYFPSEEFVCGNQCQRANEIKMYENIKVLLTSMLIEYENIIKKKSIDTKAPANISEGS